VSGVVIGAHGKDGAGRRLSSRLRWVFGAELSVLLKKLLSYLVKTRYNYFSDSWDIFLLL
jgi:hypothetical protein